MAQDDPNIDYVEISKFDALAAQWWEKSGGFKGLHDINPWRLAYIDKQAGLAGKKVLDVGCGWGSFAIYAAEKYHVEHGTCSCCRSWCMQRFC